MPKFVYNIPNTLTLFRMLSIPFASLPLLPIFDLNMEHRFMIVVGAFVSASVTDYLDGYFARKLNQMTDWGAYMDPLIDKFLIWALFATLVFVPYLNIPFWTFILILFRDLAVTQMRNYALKHHIAFKTSFFAKCKTALQMFVGGIILIFLWYSYKLMILQGNFSENYLEVWKLPFLYHLPRNLVIFTSLITALTGVDYAFSLYKQINQNKPH